MLDGEAAPLEAAEAARGTADADYLAGNGYMKRQTGIC